MLCLGMRFFSFTVLGTQWILLIWNYMPFGCGTFPCISYWMVFFSLFSLFPCLRTFISQAWDFLGDPIKIFLYSAVYPPPCLFHLFTERQLQFCFPTFFFFVNQELFLFSNCSFISSILSLFHWCNIFFYCPFQFSWPALTCTLVASLKYPVILGYVHI